MYRPSKSFELTLLALAFTFAHASPGLNAAPAQKLPAQTFAETLALAESKMQARQWAEAAFVGASCES